MGLLYCGGILSCDDLLQLGLKNMIKYFELSRSASQYDIRNTPNNAYCVSVFSKTCTVDTNVR